MGSSESTSAIEPTDVVGEVEPQQPEPEPISVQYGPNIVGKWLGYDERLENLSQAAHQLYDAVSRPSNQNRKKAQILVNDVHSTGIEHGRATISLSEIEKDMIDDIEYKAFVHKKTYGVRSMQDVDRKFSLSQMDTVCDDFRMKLEECLQAKNESSMPYFDESFKSLNCSKQMDAYNHCVDAKLSGLY